MCYTGRCKWEDRNGDCKRPRGSPCEAEGEEDDTDDSEKTDEADEEN